jgi:uncharacterized protein DUF4407
MTHLRRPQQDRRPSDDRDPEAKLADWRASEAKERRSRVRAIAGDQDLLARAEALSAIEKKHHEVSRYVLFVLGLFVCLDLVALVMKLTHLLVTRAVYEEVAGELRERDRLEAHRLREETAVLRARITAQAHGEIADEHAKLASKHPVFSS